MKKMTQKSKFKILRKLSYTGSGYRAIKQVEKNNDDIILDCDDVIRLKFKGGEFRIDVSKDGTINIWKEVFTS